MKQEVLNRAIRAIRLALGTRKRDSIPLDGSDGRRAHAVDDNERVIVSWQTDPRRNADPRDLGERSRWCFCKERGGSWEDALALRQSPLPGRSPDYLKLTNASRLCLYWPRSVANLYASSCGPQPSRENFIDMMQIASRLNEQELTIINLPGTGASVPHHFHTQVHGLEYQVDGSWVADTRMRQLKRIQPFGEPMTAGDVKLWLIARPVFGVVLDFSEGELGNGENAHEAIGKQLYSAVHQAIHYGSQMHFGYNIYIQSGNRPGQGPEAPDWRRIKILFRETRLERICATSEMYELVKRRVGRREAESIQRSPNRNWRWGWWEMIGGLMARDDSFDDEGVFTESFWNEVYDLYAIGDGHRLEIVKCIKAALETKP